LVTTADLKITMERMEYRGREGIGEDKEKVRGLIGHLNPATGLEL